MQNKIKLLLLLLLAGPLSAQNIFYLEPRISHPVITGTPDIGDIGRETGSDLPAVAAGLVLGHEVSPRLSLELRYTHLGTLTVSKVSPYATVFPLQPGEVVALVVSDYKFTQRTNLLAAALPFQVWANDRLSLRITPLLQVEWTEVELSRPPLPNANTVPGTDVFLRRSTARVQPGAEIALACRLSDRAALQLHYTYIPLSTGEAHVIGAGLQARF